MKSASQVIAGDGFPFPAARNRYTLEGVPPVSRDRPAVCNEWNPGNAFF
jgi:hypothetical protein